MIFTQIMGILFLTWYIFVAMLFLDKLNLWFLNEAQIFKSIPFVQRALEGKITRDEYTKFLLDYMPLVQNAAKMYAIAGSNVSDEFLRVKEWFYKSAYKEFNHDQFMVNDLKALGVSKEQIKNHDPHPIIDALCGYNISFSQRHHPIGALGTPFIMGRLSTSLSITAAQNIKTSLNLLDEGVSFFFAHGHLDKDQPEDVDSVIQSIVTPSIQDSILLNAKVTFFLYQSFFRSIVQ